MKSRVTGLIVSCLALAFAACFGGKGAAGIGPPEPRLAVYVGTYTGDGSRGIYRFEMNPASGEATAPTLAGESENPSFLALHPNGHVLYAVNEIASFERTGSVSAFAIDPVTGGLRQISRQSSGGADPCHLIVDGTGRNVLLANYNGGSVAVLPIDAEGRLRPASVIRRHAGSGPVTTRQSGPHAHAIVLDPSGRFALSADLGVDKIFIDRFDAATGRLEANEPDAVGLDPGSGPRHLAWHPSGKYLYAINELRSTVTVFRYDAGRGALDPVQTITTLPDGFKGENKAAELAVSSDGRFLYGSNRGDDTLALFTIDPGTGRLAASGHVPTGGRTPRHFAIDPSGRWLLVANQDSASIVMFRLDLATGRPTRAGRSVTVPRPVCIIYICAGLEGH
jgi:6-phosphogluconolactonase